MSVSRVPGPPIPPEGERADLMASLRRHRDFLRHTVREIDDEQARRRATASELTLGGLLKHVAATERSWTDFIRHGAAETGAGPDWESVDWSDPPPEVQAFLDGHRMLDDETLGGLLAAYDEVAADTDALVGEVDLDSRQALPAAPWFTPGETWSARRVLLHVIAETAQHAGHADIIRETLDGQKTMG